MKYRLLVFDWDGTIIDSAATIVECIRESAREMGLPVPEAQRASHVIGLGLHDSLRMAVPELQAQQYPDFVAHYRRHFLAREDAMILFSGMKEVLCQFSKSHSLAIATGKSRRGLDRALAAAGVGPYFSASRCADETNPKPHPAMLHELMDELGFSKNQTLMIGDTSHDLEMARAAEVDSVAVTYGAHPEEGLRACKPLNCFSTVSSLSAWLKQNA
ncbi:MAG: phosphoglycolate phosphatase [Betaproteobacteria bacterium]|jgi:phosphoglycolate phosphatase|nr:phosphoglycolate phosphatase [Betaproteobacteria bacterium]